MNVLPNWTSRREKKFLSESCFYLACFTATLSDKVEERVNFVLYFLEVSIYELEATELARGFAVDPIPDPKGHPLEAACRHTIFCCCKNVTFAP